MTFNEVQSTTLASLDSQITEQLSVRAGEARADQPDWYQHLAENYLDRVVPQRDLDAVLIWRAASNQTDAATPFGKPPPGGDHLSPLWQRMQHRVDRQRPADADQASGSEEAPPPLLTPLKQPPRALDPGAWDAMAEAWEQMETINSGDDDQFGEDLHQWAATHHRTDPARTTPAGPSR